MYQGANNHNNIYFNKYSIGKPHSEYLFQQDFTIRFINKEKNIAKQIIDKDGNILNFPGVEYTDQLVKEWGSRSIRPVVIYGASFEKNDADRFLMIWTIRPDGRYWMDSWGFGGEDYESLSLYTYIDTEGTFTMPFRLYGIGYKVYEEQQRKEGSL